MKKFNQKFSFSILKTFTEKIFLSLILLLASQQLFAQVTENFSDGSFRENPQWSGNDSMFVVSNHELQLKAPPVSGTAFLSTPSRSIIDASWSFTVRFLFNPSSSNFARYYLMSDQSDLSRALNGYFILIGGTNDDVSLCKQSGLSTIKLIDGQDGLLNYNTFSLHVRITRDATGMWTLSRDLDNSGTFTSEGAATDSEHLSAAYTGVWCRYTATRSDKIFFDDIVVTGDPYVPVPSASWKDVVITEIFADPSPRKELPEYEFIEIYNRGQNKVNLNRWSISDGGSPSLLPDKFIQPGQYLILSSVAAAESFKSYGEVVPLSGFPSLNNSEDYVILKNENRVSIDSIRYSDAWYRDGIKKDGGWSLELIDLNNICAEENNWTAAEHPDGGTPGKINSVVSEKPDLHGPLVTSVTPVSENEIIISFNEKLNQELPSPESFVFNPSIALKNVIFKDQSLRKLSLTPDHPIQRKTTYTLVLKDLYDCAGNIILPDTRVNFALPEPADVSDIIINEILFNPRPGGVDFVEIYNRSDKHINLNQWSLANITDATATNLKSITSEDLIMAPATYHVLTIDGAILKGEYIRGKEENFIIAASIPSMPDDEGSVCILNKTGTIIDQLQYSKSMHSVFIKDEEGVSLERISSETQHTSDNWKSATADAGFATPGYANSNLRSEYNSTATITLHPEIFVPESNDIDFTQIHYQFDQGNLVASIRIFDPQGRQVRELANIVTLGTEGFFRWDGDKDSGGKARVGYYMVLFQVFDERGNTQTYRKRVAIASRF